MAKWKLNHPKQCLSCPWRVDARLDDIPGYVAEKHEALASTIADNSNPFTAVGGTLNIMACHHSREGDERHCIGWLVNQLGPGNNIGLRLSMMKCENSGDIEVIGEQHRRFEDTFKENHD